MTTITIERAILDRLVDAWDSTVLPKSHDGMMQGRMEDLRAALAAPANAPAWHDAPTCAGVWMCHMNGEAYQWPDKNLDVTGTRWFGPILEDKP